jgi:hypothetical protein
MSNTNLCTKIVDEFFRNEEVKKHINVELYKNYSIKENIKYFTSMNNTNNNDSIVNCTINPNFIISEYTQNFSKENNNNKNVYLNAIYHNDKKHLNFNTTINKNDYKLK